MKNIKGMAFATDGNFKRMAITYDDVDIETGKVIQSNVKVNRVVVDEQILENISALENYAQLIIDAE